MYSDFDADEAWERLRASRSNPPARANTGSRRKTYSAALEQAQQLFRAAAVVGPATSPILTFYGLSQAGRAITAAAWSLKGEDWRLNTHGITSKTFHEPFPDIEIRTDLPGTQGSFVKVSKVLDSPVWEMDPLRLEDVWDLLPPNLNYPLTSRDRLTPLHTSEASVDEGDHSLLSVFVCNIPDRIVKAGTREALADFLTAYPAVAQHESYSNVGAAALPNYVRYDHGGGQLSMNWLIPEGVGTGFDGMATMAERQAHLRALARGYAGGRYFLPVLGSMKRDLHPLMAWWAVLYTLSMLARYEPAAWGKHINVDASPHTVPIERLLERAINHLPVLIADAITEVST
ncbi:YaaC family protein [Streptomyces sp. NBC_01451]|uniref:YaaC family protein n=1 Tax=Streptomyces sp. NBC_01451 TaxID=2903872 RepID=UPI002E33B627|nr:YaaC family protein [Streptomyces sp. NBC_01451]